jgi:hypothetical protein
VPVLAGGSGVNRATLAIISAPGDEAEISWAEQKRIKPLHKFKFSKREQFRLWGGIQPHPLLGVEAMVLRKKLEEFAGQRPNMRGICPEIPCPH